MHLTCLSVKPTADLCYLQGEHQAIYSAAASAGPEPKQSNTHQHNVVHEYASTSWTKSHILKDIFLRESQLQRCRCTQPFRLRVRSEEEITHILAFCRQEHAALGALKQQPEAAASSSNSPIALSDIPNTNQHELADLSVTSPFLSAPSPGPKPPANILHLHSWQGGKYL